MLAAYLQINRTISKWLWGVVIAGLLFALPITYERYHTEKSAKTVEVVFDYRDLVEASLYNANPELYIKQHLKKLKQAGVQSMAVYESTLDEFKNSKRLQLYNATEYALLTDNAKLTSDNSTYLLFTNTAVRDTLQPLIERTFKDHLDVNIRPWSFNNQEGLVIELPYDDAILKPMFPDPISMETIKQNGFQIVARLSNRNQPFKQQQIDQMLADLKSHGVKTIIFDGTAVTGYDEKPKKSSVETMAALMKRHGIGAAVIEPVNIKQPQFGFNKLAYHMDYNVIRLHSISEKDANLTPDKIADRLVLAVKDRNIRLLFLNTKAAKDLDKGYMNDYMDSLYTALSGPDGAIERIQHDGYTLGIAQPFSYDHSGLFRYMKLIVMLGAVALIALLVGHFVSVLRFISFLLGSIGVAGLHVLAPSLSLQALALGVSISAATLSIIYAVNGLKRATEQGRSNGYVKHAGLFFVRTLAFSLIGAIYVVALLSNITYLLLLEQFRGVDILALLPLVLAGLYVLIIFGATSSREMWNRLQSLLRMNISVLWVVLAGIAAMAAMYYLSRTGNEGQTSEVEKTFRSALEQLLGVRPRTKEFLIAHPLFVLGAYLYYRYGYRSAVYLIVIGAIGQASIIGTFTHLHTPLDISLIRVAYGAVFGFVLGVGLIGVWEFIARSWNKWIPSQKE